MGQQITRTIENFNNPGNSQIIGEKYFYDQEAIQIAGLKMIQINCNCNLNWLLFISYRRWQRQLPEHVSKTQECRVFLKIYLITAFIQTNWMINFTLKFIVPDELSFKSLQSKIYYFMQIVLYVQIFNVPFYPNFYQSKIADWLSTAQAFLIIFAWAHDVQFNYLGIFT